MSELVRIPWQSYYWLTPHTLALLVAASKRLGYNGTTSGLMLYAIDPRGLLSAWRSYAQQTTLWLASQNGGNVASNPDSGPRMHMRGGAFDLVRTDTTAQTACRAVGLVRDSLESWHWNDPLGTSMPIIKTNTAAAGGDVIPLIEGAAMSTVPVKYTNSAGTTEWARYRGTPAGGVIDKTTSTALVGRWKVEINYSGDAVTTSAKTYLTDWAARILADTAAFKAVLAGEVAKVTVDVDEAAIAAELAAHGIDFPSAVEIADAVRDEIIAPD